MSELTLTRCCYPNVKTALTWCYCSSWTSSWSCRWAPPCPWLLASQAAADKSREVRGVSQQQQPRANNKLTVRHRGERGLSVSEEHCADTTVAKRKRGKYFVLSGTGFCGNANVTLRGEPSASLALNRFPGRWGERGGRQWKSAGSARFTAGPVLTSWHIVAVIVVVSHIFTFGSAKRTTRNLSICYKNNC